MQLRRIIDQWQTAVYAHKISAITDTIDLKYRQLEKTGMVEAYEEGFRESLLKVLRRKYYKPGAKTHPLIVNSVGAVMLGPKSGVKGDDHAQAVRRMLKSGDGEFLAGGAGGDHWYIFKKTSGWNWTVIYDVPADVKYAALHQFRNLLIGIFAVVTIIAIGFLSLTVTRITRPIRTLTVASSEIADGNLDSEIGDLDSGDELGILARSFVAMRNAIRDKIKVLNTEVAVRQKAERELASLNETLEKRVQRRTAELLEAKEDAESTNRDLAIAIEQTSELAEAAKAASKAKSEFLANMSHEIRTPMNGVLGMTELMLDTDMTDEQREYMSLVWESANSLLTVINDILDFSKVEAGKMEITPIDFNLHETVSGVVRSLEMKAGKKGLELQFSIAPDVDDVLNGDSDRLRQILVNLINNAIKFTPEGQVRLSVQVEFRIENEVALHFEVRDTGIGIPSAQQGKVFEAFEQVDASTTRQYGGTGLGLAISARLVSLMGGRIWVEDHAGRGSSFHFTTLFGAVKNSNAGASETPPVEKPVAGPLPEERRRLDVLLAEDQPINQKVAMSLLSKIGCDVTLAGNGREAIDAMESARFDLILMDIQMPVMGGDAAAAAIRRQEKTTGEHVPIIAMTAHALKGDREKYLACGMDGYISKPINRDALLDAIGEVLSPSDVPPACSENEASAPDRQASPDLSDSDAVYNRRQCLDQMGGDEEMLAELTRMFLRDGPNLLADVAQAIGEGCPAGVARTAHALKGCVGIVATPRVFDSASAVESIGRSGDLSQVAEAYETLKTQVNGLIDALAAEIADEESCKS
jgi:TMAO reductase system sensor TorS